MRRHRGSSINVAFFVVADSLSAYIYIYDCEVPERKQRKMKETVYGGDKARRTGGRTASHGRTRKRRGTRQLTNQHSPREKSQSRRKKRKKKSSTSRTAKTHRAERNNKKKKKDTINKKEGGKQATAHTNCAEKGERGGVGWGNT